MNTDTIPIDWLPIETAPRDGTKILVCRAGAPWVEIAKFRPKPRDWKTGGGWCVPTHWMPLPTPV
jgi:hypothetical protein